MSAYISLPMYLASIADRLRLIGRVCDDCGTVHYPPRQVCLHCGGRGFTERKLSGGGEIYTFTVIAKGGAPAEFDDQQIAAGEIVVAVIKLAEGPRVVGQIVCSDPRDVVIGTPVHGVVRRLYDQEGIVRYGLKFQVETA